MTLPIEIKGYVSEPGKDGATHWFAIGKDKKGTRYEMPDCFKEMYNDNYLAIQVATYNYAQTLGAAEQDVATVYIPLFTGEPAPKEVKE